jgi:hypothetical protein
MYSKSVQICSKLVPSNRSAVQGLLRPGKQLPLTCVELLRNRRFRLCCAVIIIVIIAKYKTVRTAVVRNVEVGTALEGWSKYADRASNAEGLHADNFSTFPEVIFDSLRADREHNISMCEMQVFIKHCKPWKEAWMRNACLGGGHMARSYISGRMVVAMPVLCGDFCWHLHIM